MRIYKERNGVYYVAFKAKGGRTATLSTGQRNRREAEAYVREAKIEELERASEVGALTHQALSRILAGGEVTLPAAVQMWKDHHSSRRKLAPTTIACSEALLNSWIKDRRLENFLLCEVDDAMIHNYVNGESSRSRTSRLRVLSAIKSLFNFCSEKGLCTGRPSHLVDVVLDGMPHSLRESREVLPFTDEEIEMLLRNSSGFWHAAITISSETGLRLGDVAQLEWQCVTDDLLIVWTDKRDRRVMLPLTDGLRNAIFGTKKL